MKKAILVAASLFTAAVAATTGEAVKADPQFVLTQNSAGNLLFQGIGTAQYNNSIGTNNSFQVGSSTNLGVNASTSSTPEYAVQSHAKLDLADTTKLIQVIGTSGAANQTSQETSSKLDWAKERADEDVATWESSHGSTYNDYLTYWYDSSPYYDNQTQWEDARSEVRRTSMSENYVESSSSSSSSSASSDLTGVISGSFTTTESGTAAAGTMSDWTAEASEKADDEMRAQYNVDWNTFLANDVNSEGFALNTFVDNELQTAEEQYRAARSSGWTAAYNEAYTDVLTSNERESVSDVVVTGIGSDALVTSRDTSTFDVDIISVLTDLGDAESTATANGAAGANLSTSSFANQSMASTASAFMQAFGGDEVGFVQTDTTMGTNTGTGNVGVDQDVETGLSANSLEQGAE
jgi:hypothetical protein